MLNNRGLWFVALTMALPAYGAISVTLAPSPASPQPVGTQTHWTATGSDSDPGNLTYRWQVGAGPTSYVVRDYHRSNIFDWTPTTSEGSYKISVTVKNQSTGNTATTVALFTVTSNITGTTPVVHATSHPLVALYSAPACPMGGYMRVAFQTGSEAAQATPWKPCAAGLSMNFLVAGMRASTLYYMVHQVSLSGSVSTGPLRSFTTGALPSTLPFPAASATIGPDSRTAVQESVVLQCSINFPGAPASLPTAMDLSGRILWYYAPFASPDQNGTSIYRPLAGGAMLLSANDTTSTLVHQQILRQIDLLGNSTRETNVSRVSEQLVAMGQDPITSFHHDAIRLPNGHLIALASVERLLTNVQGPGSVDVVGDMLVELDLNLQVVWSWNSFDHMDTSRMAVLGETCTNGQAGCPPVTLAPIANDWLHSNSVNYSSSDGNLIVSMRHQDWVIKIDYANGSGTGNLVWRLGNQGDFTISPASTDPYPWFSHQHQAEYDVPGKPLISLFDDGTARKALFPSANSRGQAYWLNEAAHTVIQVLNADLGSYSSAFGSAQLLANGNFTFGSGLITTTPAPSNQSVEVLLNGTVDYVLQSSGPSYRNFRMYNLYASLYEY